MKKIVTVIAVCLAYIIMAGFDVQASATKAATEENSIESTAIEEEQIVTDTLNPLGKGKKKSKSTATSNSSKKTTSKKSKNSKKKTVKAELTQMDSNIVTIANNSETATSNDTNAVMQVSAAAVTEKKKASNKKKYTPAELKYMTCIIYCEARGEGYAGQMAVGIVVMNRKKSEDFPDTIKKVIYQRGQFTPTVNGSMSSALSLYEKYDDKGKFKGEMVSCYKAAKEVLEGTTTIRVDGKKKEMKDYLYFSRRVSGAKYTLGSHQFK